MQPWWVFLLYLDKHKFIKFKITVACSFHSKKLLQRINAWLLFYVGYNFKIHCVNVIMCISNDLIFKVQFLILYNFTFKITHRSCFSVDSQSTSESNAYTYYFISTFPAFNLCCWFCYTVCNFSIIHSNWKRSNFHVSCYVYKERSLVSSIFQLSRYWHIHLQAVSIIFCQCNCHIDLQTVSNVLLNVITSSIFKLSRISVVKVITPSIFMLSLISFVHHHVCQSIPCLPETVLSLLFFLNHRGSRCG